MFWICVLQMCNSAYFMGWYLYSALLKKWGWNSTTWVHTCFSDCHCNSLFLKSKSWISALFGRGREATEQLCLYKGSQHLFKRGVNQEDLHEKRESPNYRKRCSQSLYLIRRYMNWEYQGTIVSVFFVCMFVYLFSAPSVGNDTV